MSLKWIGITQRLLENTSYYEIREALSVEWGELFRESLGAFLPLPLSYEIAFERYAPHLSGVILSGGNDLNALNPNALSLMRDEYESKIITHCLRYSLPLLGICRGAQMIAHYFDSKLEPLDGHIEPHNVVDSKGQSLRVNSFHRYGITRLGEALESLSKAGDCSIESFRHRTSPIFGVMWHIERTPKMTSDEAITCWIRLLQSYSK
ncbi:gamma-glutamyl-gamma-aminobutyrate hydrolase family protein [Helicobacter sp. MIT 05-5293]|uniref:gamma-glutamyl-CDP-amidate hydrolase n=1 Tax=Helicobacter sp. MIT 05-5293 TaxID=1548149 RepID=UPI00051D5E9B|nr:gamma-glutamyl-CDP-amidate hydrolase [Helicobacter sp. MIT 05-5293]TLD80524.1 gamma-glutamyl-gamma-aminobutyrate hydrolase family protein [Helicobacter sp. MIT 05-5293]